MSDPGRLDFRGKRLEDADFSGAHLHGPSFEAARVTDGWFRDADISGFIGGLRVNGVEVAPLVAAELDRRFPQRVKLRATDPGGLTEAWQVVEDVWEETLARARELPPSLLIERVDGEWSFLETLRHLIMATDCWYGRMIAQEPRPYHPWGIAGSFLTDPAALGLDAQASPTLQELVVVRRGRMDRVKAFISSVDEPGLRRVCVPPATPGHPVEPHTVLECLHVILDEEWEHGRYANRDLDLLQSPSR